MVVQGNPNIELIQGDTLTLTLSFKNVDLATIKHVYFSCGELNITKELTKKDDKYELEISCHETCNFKAVTCCYDITVYFLNDKVKTVEYRGVFKILNKVNKVT